jgi:hypothetical protein
MRHLSLCFGIVYIVISYSADAAETNQKDYAVSFGVGAGSGLSVKKALSETTWFFANASMSTGKSEGQITSGGSTITVSTSYRGYSMSAGVRQYLSTEKLSKFIQLSLGETYSKNSGNGFESSGRSYTATAGYGLEYYIDTNLSVEGTMGLSYTYTPGNSSTPDVSSRNMNFPVVGTAITYYW